MRLCCCLAAGCYHCRPPLAATALWCCAQFTTYKRLITIKHMPLEQEGHIELIKDQLPPGVNLRVTAVRPLAVPLPSAAKVPQIPEGTPLPIDDSKIPLRP